MGLGEAGKGSWASERVVRGSRVFVCMCAAPRVPRGSGGSLPSGLGGAAGAGAVRCPGRLSRPKHRQPRGESPHLPVPPLGESSPHLPVPPLPLPPRRAGVPPGRVRVWGVGRLPCPAASIGSASRSLARPIRERGALSPWRDLPQSPADRAQARAVAAAGAPRARGPHAWAPCVWMWSASD